MPKCPAVVCSYLAVDIMTCEKLVVGAYLGSGREGSNTLVNVSQFFLEFFQGHELATNLSSLRNLLQSELSCSKAEFYLHDVLSSTFWLTQIYHLLLTYLRRGHVIV